MQKPDLIKPRSVGLPTCVNHKGEQYSFICFEPECKRRFVCQRCTSDQHSIIHKKWIMKIDEYFETLLSQPLENAKEAAESLGKLLSKEAKLIENVQESLESREREILEFFDDVKLEINRLLDLVYEKEISKIRKTHERQISKISKEFYNAKQLQNLYTCLHRKNIPKPVDETDLYDFGNTLTLVYSQKSSLSTSLQQECKYLSSLLKKEQESQIVDAELKFLNARKKPLCDFLVDNFEIRDYYDQQTNSTDSTKSGSTANKGSYSGHEGQIFSLAIINSEQIATAGFDKVIKLWNLKNGECFMELSGHQDTIWDLKAGFDGKYLFSAGEDKEIKVWKISEKKCKTTLIAHNAPVISLCVASSKRMLISGSKEGGLLAWDLEEKKVKYVLSGHNSTIRAIKTLNKEQIVSAADDGYVKIWDIKDGSLIKTIRGSEGKINSLSVFANGQRILLGDSIGELKIWDLELGKQITSILAHNKGVWTVSVSSDGTLIATGGEDKAFKIWDLKTAKLLKQVEENDSAIHCLEFLDEFSVLYCDLNPKKYKFSK